MARPKKNNAEYFTHDSDMRDDVRIKAVRRKFKLTGYAIWCCMLEELTNRDYFEIEWNDMAVELLSADFDIDPDRLKEIVDYFLTLGLLQLKNGKLYSETHHKRFKALLSKRIRDNNQPQTPQKEVLDSENPGKTPFSDISSSENPHSRVEESKVNKRKEKYIKELDFDFSFVLPDFLPALLDWLFYKYDRGEEFEAQTSVESVYRKLLALSKKDAVLAAKIVEQSKANNWAKLFELEEKAVNASLGFDERIENGRRTYGSGKTTIPMDAPPRPSSQYAWNESTNNWMVL